MAAWFPSRRHGKAQRDPRCARERRDVDNVRGSSFRAYDQAVARTSRPSASVLMISIVLPDIRLNPHRRAAAPGRSACFGQRDYSDAIDPGSKQGEGTKAASRCTASHVRIFIFSMPSADFS